MFKIIVDSARLLYYTTSIRRTHTLLYSCYLLLNGAFDYQGEWNTCPYMFVFCSIQIYLLLS